MNNVLITGAEGFIGRHLTMALRARSDVHVRCYDVNSREEELDIALRDADFIFHLAGVNRPRDPAEFKISNVDFTRSLCRKLKLTALNRAPCILFSSSRQASMDTPYGISKKAAEWVLLAYESEAGADVHILRLPNVFGQGCRPNYNSAVATFCHNIANGLPIRMDHHATSLKLVYIDDLVQEFVRIMACPNEHDGMLREVPVIYEKTLVQIVGLLHSFKCARETLYIPDTSDGFVRKLYATFLSYLPVERLSYALLEKHDPRGRMAKFIRTPDRGQVSVNVTLPGFVKGNHWHHTKSEKFLVVSGCGIIRFRRAGESDVAEYRVSGDLLEVVDIPPGYIHNIENVGVTDLVTMIWASEAFDPLCPDTYFENI